VRASSVLHSASGSIQEVELDLELTGAARTMFTADRNNDGTMDGFEKGLDSFLPNGSQIVSVATVVLVTPLVVQRGS
jgi:hypothetical protein